MLLILQSLRELDPSVGVCSQDRRESRAGLSTWPSRSDRSHMGAL